MTESVSCNKEDENMDVKRIIAGLSAFAMAAVLTGCGAGKSSETAPTEPPTEEVTEAETEAPTEEPTEPEPPHPAEASDPNAIDFNDGRFDFASCKTTDDDSANGTLEIAEVEGNKMLRFTDDGKNHANGTVQKISIDAAMLLSPENISKVKSVEMDIYADATASDLDTEEEKGVKAPGWIGGGGGANTAGDKWYQFGEWSGGEYTFPMSGAIHAQFKFMLYKSGQHWDETMDEAVLLIMRWGAQNEGNFYIDNIVFYDEEGNSLPIEYSEKKTSGEEETAPEAEEAVPEEAPESEEGPSAEETSQEEAPEIDISSELAAAEEYAAQVNSEAQDAIEEASAAVASMAAAMENGG